VQILVVRPAPCTPTRPVCWSLNMSPPHVLPSSTAASFCKVALCFFYLLMKGAPWRRQHAGPGPRHGMGWDGMGWDGMGWGLARPRPPRRRHSMRSGLLGGCRYCCSRRPGARCGTAREGVLPSVQSGGDAWPFGSGAPHRLCPGLVNIRYTEHYRTLDSLSLKAQWLIMPSTQWPMPSQ
jgi:hypothetical protein